MDLLSNIIKQKSLLQIRVWRFIVPTNYLISVYVSESEFQQWISICQKCNVTWNFEEKAYDGPSTNDWYNVWVSEVALSFL